MKVNVRAFRDGDVLVRRVRVDASPLMFDIRREPWRSGWDWVVCFAGRRVLYQSRLRSALRAVRLLDRRYRRRRHVA